MPDLTSTYGITSRAGYEGEDECDEKDYRLSRSNVSYSLQLFRTRYMRSSTIPIGGA